MLRECFTCTPGIECYTIHMAEQMDERLDLALKQIHEDESLTADLDDQGASAVLGWLEGELRAVAGADEQQLARRAEELRRAVKQVARRHADDPSALIAAAKSAAPTASVAQARSVVGAHDRGSAPVSQSTAPRRRWPQPGRVRRARKRRSWKP